MRGTTSRLHVRTGQLAGIVQGSLVGLLGGTHLVPPAEPQAIGTIQLAKLGREAGEPRLHLQGHEGVGLSRARERREQPGQPRSHVPMVSRFTAERQTLDAMIDM